MNELPSIGRFLIVAGTVIIVLGVIFLFADRIPLGHLPGDIRIGTGKVRIYIPIVTSILLSIVLTILVNLFSRR
jgi:Zn-dependent protease with chaperone function